MKFQNILLFELKYQLKRLPIWLFFVALIVFSFLLTRDGSLAEALHDDFFVNSPFAVAKTTVVGSLIWLLVAAAVAGEAGARDVATRMHPLVYSSSVNKLPYLAAKFLSAFILNAFLLLAVQTGTLLGVYLPGIDATMIGPFNVATYSTAFCFIALPNAFAATAIQFFAATVSGRPMAAFLGSLLLFFMSYIVGLFLLFQGRQDLANWLDPIGVHFILSELSHLWTPIEKSTRLVTLEGTVLANRLLWMGIGCCALLITYLQFRFTHRQAWSFSRIIRGFIGSRVAIPSSGATRFKLQQVSTYKPLPQPTRFGFRLHVRQTIAFTRDSFVVLARSWSGLPLLAVISLLSVLVIIDQMDINGVPLTPKTGRVLSELTAPLVADMSRWVIIPLFIIFYAGQLVWREKDAGAAEIVAAMPGSDWPPLLGKYFGLALLLAVFMAFLAGAGMLAQTMMGYYDYEPGLYLAVLFGLQLPEYLLFAMLALTIQVVVNNKYTGHLAAVLAWIFIAIAGLFGVEHDLLIYGAGPSWTYTEMSGFAGTLVPWFWFKLYWVGWAVLLALLAKLCWVRGRETTISSRLYIARKSVNSGTAVVAAVGVIIVVGAGAFVFYNTNVLNEYTSSSTVSKHLAEYEKKYSRYNGVAQPILTASDLKIDLYPRNREVAITGTYRLLNNTTEPIDTIHLSLVHGVETRDISFDRSSAILIDDIDFGHRTYLLKQPLQPGDSLTMNFDVYRKNEGFTEKGIDLSIVENGSFFSNGAILPAIGYQPVRELTSVAERRKYGLAPRPLIASLCDTTLMNRRGKRVNFQAVIGTDEDQIAVAPGVLKESWIEVSSSKISSGARRRYFHYISDAPVGAGQYIFSARYAVHEARWTDVARHHHPVDIRIYHDPRHTQHLKTVVSGVRASLDYYTKQFGPYAYNHVSFVEHPGDGDGAGVHAVASVLIYEEGFTFWNPDKTPGNLDHPFAIVGHEMAHQWTVPYANAEGAPVVSESLAWYYAMKMVGESRGYDQLGLLLHFMRQPHPHPPIKHGEPLLRGLDPYMSYRKGPFALYTLSKYMGTEPVNRALRKLVEKHFPDDAPLATTLDIYRELKAVTPDSLQYLLHDLFEVNTTWKLATEKATARQTSHGGWEVTLTVIAEKLVTDSAGLETLVPMDEWVEIGLFENSSAKPVYLAKHRIRSGKQQVQIRLQQKPARVLMDPNYLLHWDEKDSDHSDNIQYQP